MSIENIEEQFRKSREAAVESVAEKRESKESEMDPEAQAAAAMERADFLVKEVKSGKQQIKNIMLHIQQVLQAITALRQQLQIQSDETTNSVEQDKKQVENLKQKIIEYKDEIFKMKDELINAQAEQIKQGEGVGLSDIELRKKATELVERIMEEIEK